MTKQSKKGFLYRLDKLSLYLPAVAMGALALGTFWLVRNAPSFIPEEELVAISNDPDYRMSDFAVRSYAQNGKLQTEIHGDSGRHYPLTDVLEVDNVRIRSIDENDRTITAKADTGTSSEGNTKITLRGNAVVVQEATGKEPKMEFHGEELQVWTKEDRVQSDLPVTLIRGGDRMTGDNLHYDKKSQVVDVNGRVRATLLPSTTKAPPKR